MRVKGGRGGRALRERFAGEPACGDRALGVDDVAAALRTASRGGRRSAKHGTFSRAGNALQDECLIDG